MGPHIRSGDDVRRRRETTVQAANNHTRHSLPLCESWNCARGTEDGGRRCGRLAGNVGVATGSEKRRLNHDKGPPEADLMRQREFPTKNRPIERFKQ